MFVPLFRRPEDRLSDADAALARAQVAYEAAATSASTAADKENGSILALADVIADKRERVGELVAVKVAASTRSGVLGKLLGDVNAQS